MLQEAADKFHDIERQDSWALAVRFAITNEHGAILDVDDARVGDGDFEDVGGKIFETSFAGGNRLGVDVPVDLPDLGWDFVEELGVFYQIAELGPEDFRERFDGEKESDFGGMPGTIG